MLTSTINGKLGRWADFNGIKLFVDLKNNVILPAQFAGQNLNDLDALKVQINPDVDMEKVQIISALMIANSAGYSRLNEYLENLANIVNLGSEFKGEQFEFEKLNTFVNSYSPIDPRMRNFLNQYKANNQQLINSLGKLIAATGQTLKPINKSIVPKIPKENLMNVKKFGLYRFPFLQQEKLYIGEVEQYPVIPQVWNFTGTHFKVWINIKGIPFLVNGYGDDEYSVVNRLLASQIGKMLGLHCEEVLFGYYYSKAVTLTAFTECVNLLENQTLEMYLLDELNYIYQSEQKRCFYFLIQNWRAYAKTDRGIKERFPEHFITPEGSVFLSCHQSAMFLTPQQMPKNLMIPLEINKGNYRAIKDLVMRVGSKDLADITFGSIPNELAELHDEHAKQMNKPTFAQKKQSFDNNWTRLLESIEEFEMMRVK